MNKLDEMLANLAVPDGPHFVDTSKDWVGVNTDDLSTLLNIACAAVTFCRSMYPNDAAAFEVLRAAVKRAEGGE